MGSGRNWGLVFVCSNIISLNAAAVVKVSERALFWQQAPPLATFDALCPRFGSQRALRRARRDTRVGASQVYTQCPGQNSFGRALCCDGAAPRSVRAALLGLPILDRRVWKSFRTPTAQDRYKSKSISVFFFKSKLVIAVLHVATKTHFLKLSKYI
jgi:hypothetical protein